MCLMLHYVNVYAIEIKLPITFVEEYSLKYSKHCMQQLENKINLQMKCDKAATCNMMLYVLLKLKEHVLSEFWMTEIIQTLVVVAAKSIYL